ASETVEKTEQAEQAEEYSKNRYSPAVLKLAQEHDIDLSALHGTGLGGRITRKDVKNYIKEKPAPTQSTGQEKITEPSTKETEAALGDHEYKLTGVRKAISDNMSYSKAEIPHAWMTIEVDVTDLVKY